MDATSREIGRRWLAQAEGAFDHALAMNDRDEYSYQSLADLYLDWAKKSRDDNEAALYLAKAQETLSDGFDKGRELEYLYVMESKIQDHIGNTPGQLDALRQALEDSPSSANVRYILGNALRRAGEFDESADVLHDGLTQHAGDPRLALAYVKTLLKQGHDPAEAVSILAMARVRGLRDPAFTAAYTGLLTLAGQDAEAQDIRNQAQQRSFSSVDRRRAYFVPADYDATSEFVGSVVGVGQGYAFVRVGGFGDYFLSPGKHADHQPRVGDDLVFEPAFSTRGGTVHRVVRWGIQALSNDSMA
jgi:tetratricopeptide (TPR) repeat protein